MEPSVEFRRANTEPSVDFRKANTEPSLDFRRANTETYQKQNVNLSKRVGKDMVFLGLAGLILGISLGLSPWEIPRSSPASHWKTLSFPPLLLKLTHSQPKRIILKLNYSSIALLTMCISQCCHNQIFYWVYTDPYCVIYYKYSPSCQTDTENQLFQYCPTRKNNTGSIS